MSYINISVINLNNKDSYNNHNTVLISEKLIIIDIINYPLFKFLIVSEITVNELIVILKDVPLNQDSNKVCLLHLIIISFKSPLVK